MWPISSTALTVNFPQEGVPPPPRRSGNMREALVSRIAREAEQHRLQGGGRIVMKMNQLVDRPASRPSTSLTAGVPIDLRSGHLLVRPGLAGGERDDPRHLPRRALPRARRLYYFRNGGDEELFMGSADLMPRNLDRRVRNSLPLRVAFGAEGIMETVMAAHLDDTKG